jgi:alkanesulfonate monooxygenase SsuD/methylene tetrahydromethanopterin reductase-like flavin-dependent oxidoreductase (luciferase family)
MRVALSLPPFGHLADPGALVELAVAAEEAGFDGVWLWDHVYRPPADPKEILDPWVLLGAMALATSRVRIGPMVTPLTRRRPIKLAREAITVDHLSEGRLTLGLGLGVDTGGELTRFGEIVDARERGDRLDEGVQLLLDFWSGELVDHDGAAYRADGVTVLPRPVQQPRIPIWLAARSGSPPRPFRRAARHDGLVPIELDGLDDLERILDVVRAERGSLDGFDVMVNAAVDAAGAEKLGATWSYRSFPTTATPADVLAVIDTGPWAD